MPEPPVARGPVPATGPLIVQDGWEVAAVGVTGPLLLADTTPLAKVRVVGDPDLPRHALGVLDGAARLDERGWLRTGPAPGERLVFGPPGTAGALAAATAGPGSGTAAVAVDVTHARAMFALEGRDAAAILAKLCPLDIASRPGGIALRTSVAGIVTDLVKLEAGQPVLFLHCDRSYGHHLWSVLVEAGAGLGLRTAASRTSLLRDPQA